MIDSKALFVHDHTFHRDVDGEIYSAGGLPAKVWNRYLSHFSQLTVVGRVSDVELSTRQVERFALSSSNRVSFRFLESISGVRARLKNASIAGNEISKLVEAHDAVIARLTSEFGLLAIKEARRQKKPYAVELVDCPWDALWNYGSLVARIYAPILAWRVRSALASSHNTLYVTQTFLQSRYPSRPNANTVGCSNVEIPEFTDGTLEARRIRIFSQKSNVVIGLLGSLNGKMKGIDVALKAIALSYSKLPEFEFRVLGGGDASPWREEAAQLGLLSRTHFDGVLPAGEDVFKWLDKVDIYLHPSFKEGLPRAVVEAMSRGCPVVASNVAGTPELLDAADMIDPGDYEGLSKRLVDLVASPEKQDMAAIRNFHAAQRYSSSILDARRHLFYSRFSDLVLGSKLR